MDPQPVTARFPVEQLQVGDLLLMLGKSQLSKLIAWFGDSTYSHVSLVSADGLLIEGIRPAVKESPLADRLAPDGPVVFVDAYRSLAADGGELSVDDRAAVLRHARSMIGTTFAQDDLVTIGLLVALRGKPRHLPVWLRWLIREATEHAIRADSGRMLCSEFAYRAFADADTVPARRLARPIVLGEASGLPFPDVDYGKLQEEVREMLKPKHKVLEQNAVGVEAIVAGAPVWDTVDALELDDPALDASITALRAQLGLDAVHPEGANAVDGLMGVVWPDIGPPNPKLVRPRDLADSPASHFLGRL
ncbi:hypothetical protein [Pseudoxanthomonas sp. PXM02]|uniref:hypothetical protein n=1 Tax=Pseudoxanthomonas sp. PXM02 TaxID=2769294 RepID=UPI001783F6EF|nr:hypothetical protein [Pseudoxanthomonas sp. PXM02]MBD9477763.1 hypothetical protein [Pseudoxanthomonas sp. PXM02]